MASTGASLLVICVCFVAVSELFVSGVYCRAMNISNTWLLPEDDYPVFYRFFKDEISWFEADAVCQFHHARLVTVDTSEQFDASRAFLKELDVVQPVWLGLKSPEKPSSTGDLPGDYTFLWTNEVPLTGPGFWSQPPSAWLSPDHEFCAVTDPAADYRWTGLPCRGPHTAAFICEMPVPEWARSKDGCLLTSLPSLSVAFLPEVDAIELTADCGMEGTRKVACKGQVNRDEMMKQLTCDSTKETDTLPNEDDETGRTSSPLSSSPSVSYSSPSPSISSSPLSTDDTSGWSSPVTSNTAELSKTSTAGTNSWTNTDSTPTRMRRDTEASVGTTPTSQPNRNTTGSRAPNQIAGTQTAQIIAVVPKKGQQLWNKKPDNNKLDGVKPNPVKNDVEDKEDLMILELSDTNTPLQTTKAPILPLSPSTDKMREQLVTLVIPSTAESFKAKPVKKAVVSALTSTTKLSSEPTTSTATTTTGSTTTTTSKPLARQFESMAGPGGKSRTLTTTTTVAPSDGSSSTPTVTSPSTGGTTPTTVTTTIAPTTAPTSPTSVPTTVAETTTPGATSPTTSASSITTANRKRHLPGPLMPMSMKSIDFGEPSDNTGTETVPRSEDGEHSALVDDSDAPSARPNRGRLLFRPHQHVFYPYFFNRALGR